MSDPSRADREVEERRLAAVRRYEVLDTPADGTFDRVTALAARVLRVPIAIVSIVDTDRIWFKSHHGLAVEEICRSPGLCASAILQAGPWLVEDARSDPRTLSNPLVAGAFGLQFYAGVPLTTSDGHNLGTLCVIDLKPRTISTEEVQTLQDLAAVVVDELELRLAARRHAAVQHALLQQMLEARRRAEDDRDRSQRRTRALAETLTSVSDLDPLTGLGGRRLVEERLSAALARTAADGTPVAVFVIDLDVLARLDADHRATAGDQFLSEAAECLRTDLRGAEALGRMAGDRFVLVCPGAASSLETEAVAARLHGRLRGLSDPSGRAVEAKIGAVLVDRHGICDGAPGEWPPGVEHILAAGVVAASEVSRADGCQYRIYGRSAAAAIDVARQQAGSELRLGLVRGELRVAYQPIIDLGSGRIAGVEALVRWEHPRRGLLMPAEFLPAAEASELVIALGAYVMGTACHQVAQWNRRRAVQGWEPLNVAVNCSGRQLIDPSFAGMVRTALDDSGLDPAELMLELTESVLVDHVAAAAFGAGDLTTLGVRLAIDDFGTGYASLAYLRQFNPSVVKIDMTFVTDMCASRRDEAIVIAIIGLAHSLGAVVVAEGIETSAQASRLRQLGCDYAQGYHYAEPALHWPEECGPILSKTAVLPHPSSMAVDGSP